MSLTATVRSNTSPQLVVGVLAVLLARFALVAAPVSSAAGLAPGPGRA